MANIIVIAILVVIIAAAAAYIIRAKKRGTKCIGCPDSGCNCGSGSKCEGGCSCCKGE